MINKEAFTKTENEQFDRFEALIKEMLDNNRTDKGKLDEKGRAIRIYLIDYIRHISEPMFFAQRKNPVTIKYS